ncbi:alpha-glucosidase [Bacillus sp. B15-48]|uniref:glycoside hydrolase family 13 protein n=1 Tax=Bacillus sp. B15-48 TaxID=1548601 RepID=UPI00193FB8DC|nr:alpha-glucosidase [Bacillus sp. B15-48]MBM4762012.1 alpha,alpha-phosphotrehalase [Bacillus sp. B15-48]
MKKKWWKEAVAYQIYPRSFMDSNGDGIGDLQGIISKLDYLKDLGINVIWISPIYTSPNDDNGYDISDYKGILEDYGTMSDFDELLEAVHERKMKLIMDLVINHTSDEHPWFIESRSSKTNRFRKYYIWHPGKNGGEPNNWESIFGGSVWEFDEHTKEYYMHIFSRRQPDLNWENPQMRCELYEMINWWLDKGIDGFRVDAISHIKKAPGFPDLPNPHNLKYVPSYKGHMNHVGIQEFLQELKRETFAKYDIMTVGEANGVAASEANKWVGEDEGIFNMIFQFEHLDLWGKSTTGGIDIHALKETFHRWQTNLDGVGWNALFLENHDQPRSVSTWGDSRRFRVESGKSLATLYFLMQGTPFIYQGQEIGMTNVKFSTIDEYQDIAIKNLYQAGIAEGKSHDELMQIIWKNGRDNARTPMQWTDEKNAGFTSGTPWLKINPNYKEINVKKELADPNSIYTYYKKLIEIRKKKSSLLYGSFKLILAEHEYIFSYLRVLNDEIILVITNLFPVETEFLLPEEIKYEKAELLLNNYSVSTKDNHTRFTLRPFEARVYQLDKQAK